ncbi:MAG: hypothetical protein J6A79_04130 [Clostridia bacterium]|nr:hypothetical protein [Eubacterium sp.]MBO5568108.1 hypothetical protein [Clostridia bacterium]
MAMFEKIIQDQIFIDFGCDVHYGDDQIYLDHLCRFATVGFQLMSTSLLSEIADRIRKEQGFPPLHPMDEYTDEKCDQDGWYDFYIDLNDWDETKVDTCIEAVVCNSSSADEGARYAIDLSPDEQIAIYNCLDEQCRKYLGKSCADLLAEARKAMEDDA